MLFAMLRRMLLPLLIAAPSALPGQATLTPYYFGLLNTHPDRREIAQQEAERIQA